MRHPWPDSWHSSTWKGSDAYLVTERLLEHYKKLAPWNQKAKRDDCRWNSYYTPYQFLFPIMQEVYVAIEGPENCSPKREEWKTKRKKDPIDLHAHNPNPREVAWKRRLRAVVYLSWEPDRRHFLIRRVFPTYFDFLSISYVPEGWGASARMIKELKDRRSKGRQVKNGDFYSVVNVGSKNNLRFTLPYLAERERLRYECVVVVPVFQTVKSGTVEPDLIGTYLFFLTKKGLLVRNDQKLHRFFRGLANATAELVRRHDIKLGHGAVSLAKLWEKLRRQKGKHAEIARIQLAPCPPSKNVLYIKSIELATRKILSVLSSLEFYAVQNETSQKLNSEVLVVAQSEITAINFRKRMLNILSATLSDDNVRCILTFEDSIGAEHKRFQLQAGREWCGTAYTPHH